MAPSTHLDAPVRLLALDVDGTLLDSHGRLPPVVRDAVRRVVAHGTEVVLATGRSPWYGVAGIARSLGLSGLALTMQGALALEPLTGRVVRGCSLEPSAYLDALALAEELGIEPVVATPHGHRAARARPELEFVQGAQGADRFQVHPRLADLVTERPMRVYLPTGAARHHAVRLALAQRFLGRAAVVWSDLEGVELIAHGINKGEAIEWLAARAGIALEQVMAVGDAWNDIEMLRVAGRSAAMGTAPAEVKAAAAIVVPGSDEEGVVDAIAWGFPHLAGVAGHRPRATSSWRPA